MHIALSPWQTRIILLTKTFLSWTRRAYVGCLSSGSRRGYGTFLPDQRSRLELAQRNTLLTPSARETPRKKTSFCSLHAHFLCCMSHFQPRDKNCAWKGRFTVRFSVPLYDFGGAQVDVVDRLVICLPASNVGEMTEEVSDANNSFRVMTNCGVN